MNCHSCGSAGKLPVKTTRSPEKPGLQGTGLGLPPEVQHKMGAMPFTYRVRVCDNCGAVIATVEVPLELLEKAMDIAARKLPPSGFERRAMPAASRRHELVIERNHGEDFRSAFDRAANKAGWDRSK